MDKKLNSIGYIECFSGLSGDMLLGSLVDAGADFAHLASLADSLGLGAELGLRRVARSGVAAAKVDVLIEGRKELVVDEPAPHEHEHEHGEAHEHPHDHDHDHIHEHEHDHAHEHEHVHEHGREHVHRGLREIRPLIAASRAGDEAKAIALRAFEILGAAEGKIHGAPADEVHFHEVGSADAIVDIVCCAEAASMLGVGRWMASPVNVGGGMVRCAHGVLPVPAPATAEILRGAPIYSGKVQKELTTPTGAALLRALCGESFGERPAMRMRAIGYGAGDKEFAGAANVARVSIGEEEGGAQSSDQLLRDEVTELRAALDDCSPQLLASAMEKLLAAGAVDVFATPVVMKKGRSGIELTVLARPETVEALLGLVFRETSTLGVRLDRRERRMLAREFVAVETPYGSITVKCGRMGGELVNVAPEFEECRRRAEEAGVSVKQAQQTAIAAFLALPKH